MYKIESKKHKLLKAYTGTRMRDVYVTGDGNAIACLDGKARARVELASEIESGWYKLSAGSIIKKIKKKNTIKFPTNFFKNQEGTWRYILPSGGYVVAVTAAIRALDDKTTINPELLKPFYDYVGEGASLLKNNGNLFFAEAPGCKLIFATTKL